MTINEALAHTHDQPDAIWLLLHVLGKDRNFLITFPDHALTTAQEKLFLNHLARLTQEEPVAYILGEQPFYNIILAVTPDVLIPRSETELLVEFVLHHFSREKNICIADLGTGSGAIALALAHEQPDWEIHATDISATALDLAEKNALYLQINNVSFHTGDWCHALPPKKFSAIISNPPYIARDDAALDPTVKNHEPALALFSDEEGLAAIKKIIRDAKNYLEKDGLLIIEHGYQQGSVVRALLCNANYKNVMTHQDYAGHDRFTTGVVA